MAVARRLAPLLLAGLLAVPALGRAGTPPAAAPPEPGGAPSALRGAALFRDPALGTSGKACVHCHEGGRRLDPDDLAEASDAKLAAYANSCIAGMLKGPPLPEGSARLRSLVLHLRTYQAPRR